MSTSNFKSYKLQKTPQEIVKILDLMVVGHLKAKKCLANSLRDRWRRLQLQDPLKSEIIPKNILMIGSTGVGKTELARRLAYIADAPFIKVEATKFTEVGYIGRDVDQIIRDLVEIAIQSNKITKDENEINLIVENKLLDLIYGANISTEFREKERIRLKNGELEDVKIELDIKFNMPKIDNPNMNFNFENAFSQINKAFGNFSFTKTKINVKEARKIFLNEEREKITDTKSTEDAIQAVEQRGIVFIDEIDKIVESSFRQSDKGRVSREGVQRDLLPLVEGTSIATKYGTVKTDHILFIASGAFHISDSKDLIPELRGRFPSVVKMESLGVQEFIHILKHLNNNLIYQYQQLLKIDDIKISFDDDAIAEIAKIAFTKNAEEENLGARRLHQLLEIIISDISYNLSPKVVNFTAKDIINILSIHSTSNKEENFL